MEYELVSDTFAHPTRSSIATIRTLLGTSSDPCKVKQQLTASMDILNAIAAYLFGKATKDSSSSSNTGQTEQL